MEIALLSVIALTNIIICVLLTRKSPFIPHQDNKVKPVKTRTKAKIVRVPRGDQKKLQDKIESNSLQGKPTRLSDLYG